MSRDIRYTTVKNLIESGYIKSFGAIFPIIPKSVVAHDLGMNNARFTKLILEVDRFTLKDIFRMARFFDTDEKVFIDLVFRQHEIDKKK